MRKFVVYHQAITHCALPITHLLCGLLASLWLVSCGFSSGTSWPNTPVFPNELYVLNRADNIDPDLYDAFQRETGIRIVETTYDGDKDLLSELKAPSRPYDLIVASDRALAMLRNDGRLAPLNHASLANFQQVEARVRNLPFDPGNQVSMPYTWGTLGLLYRTDLIKSVDSWGVLFNESSGKAALLDDPRIGLGAALKWLGLSLNSTAASELERAKQLLLKQRNAIRFDSAAWSDALLTGEVVVTQARSNDAAFTQFANANLRYVIPKEGAPLWVDSLAIPKQSARKGAAETFINFLLRADNAASVAAHTYSLSPVAEAYSKMEASRAALFRSGYIPDDRTFTRLELILDVGAAQKVYERIWTELKSG